MSAANVAIGRERQQWLGVLALAVALPLPFTGIVSIPFLVPFVAVAAVALFARTPLRPVPAWVENILALGIAAVVLIAGGAHYGALRPVAQLAVLVAAVRLPGAFERKRSAMAFGLLVLVGVAGIASSTHILLVPYLIALLALTLTATARLQILTLLEHSAPVRGQAWPPARLVVITVAISLLVAAPLFALFPRLRSPFAAAPFGLRPVSGFREAVALNRLGDIKESLDPVLRIRFHGVEAARPDWLRLSGATLRHYRGGMWAEGRRNASVLVSRDGRTLELVDDPPTGAVQRATVELLEPGEVLFVPPGAISIEAPAGVEVWRDPLGNLRLPRGVRFPLRYTVHFVPEAVIQPDASTEDTRMPPDSANVVELAERVAGDAVSEHVAAVKIEEHLRTHYGYSTRLASYGVLREDPVRWFLFRGRQGHCELFASAMVLMLRAIEVPARMQVGFAGGIPEGDATYLVRDAEAHAWVVAQVRGSSAAPGEPRWLIYEPTPPEGQPGVGTERRQAGAGFGFARIGELWDRWVLTYSLADQVEGALALWDLGVQAVRRWWLAPLAVLLVLGARLSARRLASAVAEHRRREIGGVLAALMSRARTQGVLGAGHVTPREFARLLGRSCPPASAAARWLVARHEACRYADGPLPRPTEVAAAVRSIRRELERVGLDRRAGATGRGSRPSAARPRSRPPGSGR